MSTGLVIIVDDEKQVLNSLKSQVLLRFGKNIRCETAESATEALDLIEELELEKYTIIIVVTDWLMPGIKGDEFLIKLHHIYPSIFKLLLTGEASQEAIENAIQFGGVFKVFYKPWNKEQLLGVISTEIAHASENRAPNR